MELLVGVAVGLFVVAAAALLVSGQLTDNRKLLQETQLQQDLRAAADLIAREVRRTGYTPFVGLYAPTPTSFQAVSAPANAATVKENTLTEFTISTIGGQAVVLFDYRRGVTAAHHGFTLLSNALKSCQTDTTSACSSDWQELTDSGASTIVGFVPTTDRSGSRAAAANADSMTLPCPNLCPDGTSACWPKVQVRQFSFEASGKPRSEADASGASVRKLTGAVRIRNDLISPLPPANGSACPAVS